MRLWLALTGTFAVLGLAGQIWVYHLVLDPLATGVWPLDTRWQGYGPEHVRELLRSEALPGLQASLMKLRFLDTVFPLALGAFLAGLAWQGAAGLHPWSRMTTVLPAAGYVLMDLSENALLRDVLRAGPEGASYETMVLASQFTITKFVLLLSAAALIVGLMVKGRGKA